MPKAKPLARKPPDLPALGRRGVELLAAVPMFAELSRRQLKRIAELTQVKEASAGSMLVTAGAPGSASFFVIVEGKAEVVKDRGAVAALGPGDFFGELGVIDGGRRTASVVASSDLVALRLSRTAFREVIEAEPAIGTRIMEALVARVRELEGVE